jgi:hypothetical protein
MLRYWSIWMRSMMGKIGEYKGLVEEIGRLEGIKGEMWVAWGGEMGLRR